MGQLVLKIAGLLPALFVNDSLTGLLPYTKHCGQSFENRIYGGSTTNIGEHPWVVLIESKYPNNTKEYNCGGSLINNRYVLPAAHCVRFDAKTNGTVSGLRLGEWNITTDPDCQILENGVKVCADRHLDVGIEKIHVHPNYSPNTENEGPLLHNDIALIRLDRNINFTDFIQPIWLPVRPGQYSKLFDGVAMQVTGWGLTEAGTRTTVKTNVIVPGVEFESCRRKYLNTGTKMARSQMCADDQPGKNNCKYDSDGPLMVKESVDSRDIYFLVGIVSFSSEPCGKPDWPGIYTYMEWIESLLQP